MTKKSCRKTEYQKQYRKSTLIQNIPHYVENRNFRLARKQAEYLHTPFLWEDSSSSSSSESEICDQNQVHFQDAEIQQAKKVVDSCCQTQPLDSGPDDVVTNNKCNRMGRTHVLKDREDSCNLDAKAQQSYSRKPAEKLKGKSYTIKSSRQLQDHRHPDKYNSAKPQPKSRPTSASHKSPFYLFGWADKEDDLARHRTYNVLSNQDVYPSAVVASKRRRKRQKDAVEQCKKKQPLEDILPQKLDYPCEWETEYSAHFKYNPSRF